VDYEPSSLAWNAVSGDIAVGGSSDNKAREITLDLIGINWE